MKYYLIMPGPHPWNYGRGLLNPGRYRVPEDVPEELAKRAVKESDAYADKPAGKMFKKGAPENKGGRPT